MSRTHFFITDTAVYEHPNAEKFADIAKQKAFFVCGFGYQPWVAFSTFGHIKDQVKQRVQRAVYILCEHKVDFEFDEERRNKC
ncbi:MAG: NADP-dependent malic enzyme [Bartonella clarridgeiae]|nr:MAG: NADP-dependent malic enzyme [Bartonella clarridgeiae]